MGTYDRGDLSGTLRWAFDTDMPNPPRRDEYIVLNEHTELIEDTEIGEPFYGVFQVWEATWSPAAWTGHDWRLGLKLVKVRDLP